MKLKQINTISLINSFKTALACLLGLIFAILLRVPSPQWTIITILVVMASQNRVGGAIRKGSIRFIATVAGAVVAALIIFLFSVYTVTLYSFVILFIFIFTYLAGISKEYQDAYTLGSVTIVMILVTNNPQLQLAYDRFFEIMLGVVTALLVTKFIYPIHAKFILRKNIAKILQQTAELYTLAICEKQSLYSISQYSDLEEDIIQRINLQPTLLKEALLESIKMKRKKTHFTTIHRLLRRLLRAIYMMYESLQVPKDLKPILKSDAFALLNQDIIQTIKNISAKLENKKFQLVKLNLEIYLEDIISNVRKDWEKATFHEQIKMATFIFCSQYLQKILNRLISMVQKI